MAKRSSGPGWLLLVVAVILTKVPKEVWIGGGVLLAFAAIYYLFFKPRPSIVSSPVARSSPYSQFSAAPKIDRSISADSCWVQRGATITVREKLIPGGMIYVGSGLASVSGYVVEPALIDPQLPVSPSQGTTDIGYWSAYSEISPAARHLYLDWLSKGRQDRNVDIGFVFLFFYGLERRAMFDHVGRISDYREEVEAIISEVERLRIIYGHNSSFARYTASFLDTVKLLLTPQQKRYLADPPAPADGYRQLLLSHKLALGQAAVDGVPLPASWAYAWVMNDEGTRLKTPATRCADEFRVLFFAEYQKEHGDGIRLPVNKTKIKASYYPASASFGHREITLSADGLPDITVLSGPIGKLRQLAEHICEELDPYSRLIGRNPASKATMDALVLLPPALWPEDSVRNLREWLAHIGANRNFQTARFSELMSHFPAWGSISKDRLAAFATALEHFDVGMEPDVRWGGSVPADNSPIVLFPLSDTDRGAKPSALYAGATLTLHLAAAVAASDGHVSALEERHLEEQIEQWLHLSETERRRLRAHLKCLLLSPPGLTALKKRVTALPEKQREAIASFLIDVAQIEGEMDPGEVKVLGKIYRLLGLPEEALFSEAHAAATAPVTVTKTERSTGFALPRRPPAVQAKPSLDSDRIARLKEESAQVSAMLGSIFTESDEATAETQEQEKQPQSVAGLDKDHFELACILASRPTWARNDLTDLAADRNLLLDGALEHINEAFFETFNEPLFEGEDPLEINQNVLKELTAQ